MNNTNTTLKTIFAALFSLSTIASKTTAQTVHTDKVNIGLVYPISTNGVHAAADTNVFSLNLISGVSAAEQSFAFAGVSNIIRQGASGVQFAGFSNHLGENSEGLLFAGFANTYSAGAGLQFAGFSNLARKAVNGVQFAGFLNRSTDIRGFQFAGFSNVANEVIGSQFAGFINTSKQVEGSQFAGFANITGKQSHGSQFAGFMNKANDINGSQFAGFINVAKKVKGAQIAGFINVADSSDYPVGIINIVKNGEKSIGLSIDENSTSVLAFRSGGKNLYGIIGGGYNFNDPEDGLYAFEAGLGAHFKLANSLRINTELTTLMLEDFRAGEYFKSSFRLLPALKLGRSVEVYGGPAFNWVNTNTSRGRYLTADYISEWTNRNDYFGGIYIGYTAGMHFLL
ncbi:MAG TPA: hypothetical protein VGE26_12095 [Sphingobacteriaceae bacterium]